MNDFAYALLKMALGHYQEAKLERDDLFTEDEMRVAAGGLLGLMRLCDEIAWRRIKEQEDLGDVYMDFFFKVMGVEDDPDPLLRLTAASAP